MIKSYRTAQILARKLLDEARENELQITADLQNIASKFSAEMVSLENRFKMDYFILRNQKTGEIIKIGRYRDDGITESLRFGEWIQDRILDSDIFDDLLEQVSEAEAKKNHRSNSQRRKDCRIIPRNACLTASESIIEAAEVESVFYFLSVVQ